MRRTTGGGRLAVRFVAIGFFAAAFAAVGMASRTPAGAASPAPVTATPTKAPDRSPTLKKLLVLLMTHPTEKHDVDPNRISFILRTGDFKTPTQPGRPVDEKDPKTYVVERASLALVDTPPFALSPEQIGSEDTLIVQVFLASSGHMQWHVDDKGAKGPAPGGADERIPFFGRDRRTVYREYLDLILASLQVPAKKQR